MFCPNCGTEVEGKFCPKCGEPMDTVESIPNPEPQLEKSTSSKYSLKEFLNNTIQKKETNETFQLENNYLLGVNVNGKMWTKLGSMVAYHGDLKFRREGTFERGIDKFVKKAVTGEATTLMKVKGRGYAYLADQGKEITILNLQNDKIYVNGNDVLAFEETIDWDIKVMTHSSSMMSGGLFNIRLEGTGMVAITTHYTPITLRVSREAPLMTDPNATVAWSGGLSPDLKTDIDLKTLIGKDSGETFQMKFQGDGFVIIQPFEE
jgi:uncharacterized protein (AIM24 family)